MENLKEMDSFLHRYHIPKLNPDQINYLSRAITPKEREAVIKSLTSSNIPGSDGFGTEFYQTFKEEPILILFKFFHTNRNRRNIVKLFL